MSGALFFNPSPAADVLYPSGSIVVCRECGKPIYRLQRAIYENEPVGKSSWKYVPVSVEDLHALIARFDLEPGQRAAIKAMSLDEQREHCRHIPTLKAGDHPDCPACKKQFCYGFIPDNSDGAARLTDKSFKVSLNIIPPAGLSRPVRH